MHTFGFTPPHYHVRASSPLVSEQNPLFSVAFYEAHIAYFLRNTHTEYADAIVRGSPCVPSQ